MYRIPQVRVALVREGSVQAPIRRIRCPQDAVAVLRALIGDYDREAFGVLLLDTKHGLLGVHIASVGALDRTLSAPREVFRAAIVAGAKAIIVGHNHPSGDPSPSQADLENSRMLTEAGRLVAIPILDHLVLGRTGYVRLHECGDGDDLEHVPDLSPAPVRREVCL